MTSTQIRRRADRIFQGILLDDIAIHDQQNQEDCGIDYDMEVTTSEGKSTGFTFKVQQKGTEHLQVIQNGKVISYNDITVEKIASYLRMDTPVIFVIVDVLKKSAYWVTIQGNPQVENAYNDAASNKRKKLTIHIPIQNILPATFDKLFQSIEQVRAHLVRKAVCSLSPQRIIEAAIRTGDIKSLGKAIQTHHNILRIEEIERLLRDGKRDDALKKSWDILNSPSENVNMRFSAGLNVVRITGGMLARSQKPEGSEKPLENRFIVYVKLLDIVRPLDSPIVLRNHAKFLLRTARLARLVEHDWGLFLNHKLHQNTGDEFTRFIVNSARQSSTVKIFRELQRVQNSLTRLMRCGGYELLVQAWTRLVVDLQLFLYRLRDDNMIETENRLKSWLLPIGNMAIEFAQKGKRWSEVMLCVLPKLSLVDPSKKEEYSSLYNEVYETIESIEDEEEKRQGLEWLEECSKSILSQGHFRELSIKEEIEIYKQMARSLGIDPDNPKNRIDQIVHIGLRDLNPERVLRHCKHLFVSLGCQGIPAEMLRLPTAGSKWLHCTKHYFSLMTLCLDELYRSFYEQHCKNCGDCIPHKQGWKWTRSWQEEQNKKFKHFIEKTKSVKL